MSIRRPPTTDLERLDAASKELATELARSRRCTEEMAQFTSDVDTNKISTDGVVLDPFDDEDTMVRHVRAVLHDLAG